MPVVDASLVVDWVAPDAAPDLPAMAALASLAASDIPLLAPRLLWEEVGNALLTGARRQRWSGAGADSAFRRLTLLPVRVVDSALDVDRAWELARRYDNHPIYDMVYVALAQRMATQLITKDRSLRQVLGEPPWVVGPAEV